MPATKHHSTTRAAVEGFAGTSEAGRAPGEGAGSKTIHNPTKTRGKARKTVRTGHSKTAAKTTITPKARLKPTIFRPAPHHRPGPFSGIRSRKSVACVRARCATTQARAGPGTEPRCLTPPGRGAEGDRCALRFGGRGRGRGSRLAPGLLQVTALPSSRDSPPTSGRPRESSRRRSLHRKPPRPGSPSHFGPNARLSACPRSAAKLGQPPTAAPDRDVGQADGGRH